MRTLLLTFAGLIALLTLTVWAAMMELGPVTLPISMAISLAKMLLILVFFMHLRASGMLLRILACSGFIWLALLFTLSFDDFAWRTAGSGRPAASEEARPLPGR